MSESSANATDPNAPDAPDARESIHRPPVSPAWFHAHGQLWVPFADIDNVALEEGWNRCRPALELRAATRARDDSAKETQDDASGWFSTSKWFSKQAAHAAVLPPPPPPPLPNLRKTPLSHRRLDPDEDEDTRKFRVPVLEDRLYDVDLERMIIYPALWPGFDQGVMRATWFYVASDGACSPIAWGSTLSNDLDRVYEEAKPWHLVGRLRATLHTSSKSKPEPSTSQLYDLPSVAGGAKVLFDTAYSARVYTQNFSSKLLALIWEPLVVRGYENAKHVSARMRESKTSNVIATAWARRGEPSVPTAPAPEKAASSRASASDKTTSPPAPVSEKAAACMERTPLPAEPPQEGVIVEDVRRPPRTETPSKWTTLSEAFLSRTRALRGSSEETVSEEAPAHDASVEPGIGAQEPAHLDLAGELFREVPSTADLDEPQEDEELPQHLVFCIHGIGQKLSEDYMATHFVHDIERLRATLRQQAQDPAMSVQLSKMRIRLLPICWRNDVDFDPEHGQYKLQDITNDTTIPAVRTVVAKVLLDIPFYFSNHRTAMLNAVRLEANRLYRLFVQRNPEFERRGGMVSVLGHSLGSALASDLLAAQPTYVPPLYTHDTPEIHRTTEHLLFNVQHFFSVGSPIPALFYLNGSRLIARRRPDSSNVHQRETDVTSEAVGQQGCLAAHYVHNIYAATDPVSFQISATVDAPYARLLRPVEVPRDPALLDRALNHPRLSIGSVVRSRLYRTASEAGSSRRAPTNAPQHEAPQESKPDAEWHATPGGAPAPSEGNDQRNVLRVADANGGDASSSRNESTSPKRPASPLQLLRSALPKSPGHERPSPPRTERASSPDAPPPNIDIPPSISVESLEASERRFLALNPYGCIDFVVDSGSINQFTQYIDMFRAHMSYWTSPGFCNYLLKQLIPGPFTESAHLQSPPVQEALHALDPAIDSV